MRFISRGIWNVRHEAQAKGLMHLHPIDATAAEDDLAAGRRRRARQQVEKRRLACSIGADEPRDGAWPNIEGAVIDSPQSAEVLHEVAHFEDGRCIHGVLQCGVLLVAEGLSHRRALAAASL